MSSGTVDDPKPEEALEFEKELAVQHPEIKVLFTKWDELCSDGSTMQLTIEQARHLVKEHGDGKKFTVKLVRK